MRDCAVGMSAWGDWSAPDTPDGQDRCSCTTRACVLQDGARTDRSRSEGTGRRVHTRRITVNYDGEQHLLYTPRTWNRDTLNENLALHFAPHPEWIRLRWQADHEVRWQADHEVEIEHGSRFPQLTTEVRRELQTQIQGIKLTPTERSSFDHRDIYLGHRASRAHGVIAATKLHASPLKALNRMLQNLFPHSTWNALGIVEHGTMPTHKNLLAQGYSFAVTVTSRLSILN